MWRNRLLLICVVFLFCISVVMFNRKLKPEVSIDSNLYLVDSAGADMQYEVTGSNTMICDLETVSSVVKLMKADGYDFNLLSVSDDYIDFVLSKDKLSIRILYKSDKEFTSIANVYEKSYVPITYINEGNSK